GPGQVGARRHRRGRSPVPQGGPMISLVALLIAMQGPAPEPRAAVPFALYVSSESGDVVTHIEVGPNGWRKVREVPVGILPTDPDGPHNVAVAPDGKTWYV